MAEFETTSLEGVYIITPRRFGDHRGFFSESYSERVFADAGIDIRFVQDNHSLSGTTGTVRGLHFQSPPHAQAKDTASTEPTRLEEPAATTPARPGSCLPP